MFLFKKIVSQFFFPMPLCLLVCFAGLGMLWWSRWQKLGKILVTTGLVALMTLSYQPVADALLLPLERRYPVYQKRDGPPAQYVVVLGGGHTSDPSLPVSSQLREESLRRAVEGVRVHRQNPGSRLVLSGGGWLDPVPEARLLAETVISLGVDPADIIVEEMSRDTSDQARLLKNVLNSNRFVLVTSATHLPRSMRLFEAMGLKPEPCPADHLVKRHSWHPALFFPRAHCLRQAERAVYEYLGLAWVALRDRLSKRGE